MCSRRPLPCRRNCRCRRHQVGRCALSPQSGDPTGTSGEGSEVGDPPRTSDEGSAGGHSTGPAKALAGGAGALTGAALGAATGGPPGAIVGAAVGTVRGVLGRLVYDKLNKPQEGPMRKVKATVGKDVLSLADGRKIHSVKELLIGADNAEIVALLVDDGGLLGTSQVVPFEAVHSFGRDAVVVTEPAAVVPASRYPPVAETIDAKDRLIGKKVFTDRGDQQGTVSDIYFDESSGRILGLEVSGGVINNIARGNSYLPVEEIIRVGVDVVYMYPEAVEGLEAQTGGVQGALTGARERLGEAADGARQRAGQAGTALTERAGAAGADARGRAESARPEEALLGRRAGSDVEDDEGSILVAANERITERHLELARERGKLRELGASVAAGQAQELKDRAGSAAGQASDSASGLWDAFTSKLSEMTDAAGRRVDEEQTKKRLADIEDAVGRPVTKVILDRQDNVILNLGQLITHQAVQRAYEAGGLDALLNSVYRGSVEFSKEEMRAPDEVASTALTIERASGEAPLVDELEQKLEQAEQERRVQRDQSRAQTQGERERREQERQERARQREADTERSASGGGTAKTDGGTTTMPGSGTVAG